MSRETDLRQTALTAAGKVALAGRLVLSATPLNMTNRAGQLEDALNAYDAAILELSEEVWRKEANHG